MSESSSRPMISPRLALRLFRALSSALFLLVHLPAANGQAQDHSTDALRKFNESVDALIRRVSPSVVQILVTGYGPLEEGEHGNTNTLIGRQRAIGSGFVIDPSGYIVTNAHVVKGAQRVQVVLPSASADGSVDAALSTRTTIVPARIVGASSEIDLAVIKVDAGTLPALPLASYRKLGQGEIVFAFGSPGGLRNTVTMGVVSAVARQTDLDSPMVYIQTDAPINPGNSGGPLVTVNGEVAGVNTFILSQSGGNEGLGFAIPSGVVNVAFQQLRKFGHLHRAEIGIGIQTITPSMAAALMLPRTYGVVVSDVLPGSPAEAAGVEIGDVLASVDGKAADSLPLVAFHFYLLETGDKVHLEVLRGKDRLVFNVSVMEPPRDMDQVTGLADPEKNLVPTLGILGVEIDKKIASMAADLRDPFGIIVAARSAGAGVEVPLNAGDVIRMLNGQPMTTLDRLRGALKALPPGAPVALQIQRDQKLLFVSFTLDQP
ncbi:MAG: peptidase S1 [Acidobacteria bacterium]|nr:MAG: peptidase S1 [Acidobacteriota bacterium]PYU73332.1 MAG: peptidase S1 [Acidobacteriota bacterium]